MSSIFYRRFGTGAPIFLLHGFCGASGYWLPLVERLSRQFDVIAPDLPGFGRSSNVAPCRTLTDFAKCIVELADSLNLEHFSVVGHSMGGFITQRLLCSFGARIRSAVFYGNGLRIDPARRFESAERTIQRLRDEGAAATADRVVATWFVDGERSPYFDFCRRAGDGMTVEAGIAGLEACHAADLKSDLAKAATPSLVITGAKERTFPPEMAVELYRAIPNAELCILPQCAHAAHLDRPEIFSAVLLDFFSRTAGRLAA